MGRAFQQYTYNGWEIRYSDYLKKWELNPIFRGEDYESKYDNFYNNEFIVFNTLKESKVWTKTQEAKDLLNKYC